MMALNLHVGGNASALKSATILIQDRVLIDITKDAQWVDFEAR